MTSAASTDRHVRRLPALAAVAALTALAVAACGGASGNGIASKSPAAIIAAAGKAMSGAKSVRVTGTVRTAGEQVGLDITLVSGRGARGHVSLNGLSVQVVAIGSKLYINGSPSFWAHFGGTAAAALLKGKWLQASTTSGPASAFAGLINLHSLLGKILAKANSESGLKKGSTITVNGQSAIGVSSTTQNGTLYVATTGTPYPVELTQGGASGGRMVFSDYDQSVALTAPSGAINLSQLAAGAGG